jgi:hypothetical protein
MSRRSANMTYATSDHEIELVCGYINDDQTVADYFGVSRERVEHVRSEMKKQVPRWLFRSPHEERRASSGIDSHMDAADDAERGSRKLNEALQSLFHKWEQKHGFQPGAGKILLPAGYSA